MKDKGYGNAVFCLPRLRCLLVLIALCVPLFGHAQQNPDEVKDAPALRQAGETYRLRVQNAEYGRVELSADGGLTYILIGRVRHPAAATLTDRSAGAPGIVLRSNGDGLAFTVGAGRIVKLRPEPHAASSRMTNGFHLPTPTPAAEMTTNLSAASALFRDLAPPIGTPVRLQTAPGMLAGLTSNHVLASDDVFVFIVSLPAKGAGVNQPAANQAGAPNGIDTLIAALGRAYAGRAVARARAEGRLVASGILTLNAKLPEGEPDPIVAVTYSIDDDLLAAQNVGPYAFNWDTHRVPDGEHVVGIDALNRNGRLITHARALVVVDNGKLPAIPISTRK